VLPTTWEDLLACGVSGLIGYLAILNLPLRRAETKAKVKRVAANFANQLSEAMNAELAAALDGSNDSVMGWIRPLVEAARKEVETVGRPSPQPL
jgi:cell division inhibitor SulA